MAEMGKKIGTMPCPEHAAEILLVRENEKTGTQSARCDECDDTHYARKGTGKYQGWQKKITRTAPAAPPPPPPGKGEKKDEKKSGVLDDIV